MKALIPYVVTSALIGSMDLAAGREITLWVLLLLPLALSTWNLGRLRGGLIAILSTAIAIGVWWVQPAPQGALSAAIVLASRAAVFASIWALVSQLRRREVERVYRPQ